jgi:hypothetical protein
VVVFAMCVRGRGVDEQIITWITRTLQRRTVVYVTE